MKLILGGLLLVALAIPTNAVAEQSTLSIMTDVLVKTTQSWDGSDLPAYLAGQPEVSIFKVTIPAGAKFPLHLHPVITAGVLIKGELTVTTQDGDTLQLNAGDAAVEVVDKWHAGENSGDGVAEIIVFYAGIKGQPVTVKR